MKIRVRDRIFCALSGLILLAGSAALIAEAFFGYPVAEKYHSFISRKDVLSVAIVVAVALVLILLGIYCVGVLFRHAGRSGNFVVQKTETGELSISIKALEGLVNRCIEKHNELHVSDISLDNTRDGLVIKLKISLATGVNIPLTVNNLQKQIKQYVTSCSGVDVKEVRVQVETTNGKAAENAPYTTDEPAAVEKAEEIAIPEPGKEEAEEKKRPFHQRLFGKGDVPVTVPVPPAEEQPVKPEEAAPETASEEATVVPEIEAPVTVPEVKSDVNE